MRAVSRVFSFGVASDFLRGFSQVCFFVPVRFAPRTRALCPGREGGTVKEHAGLLGFDSLTYYV